MSGMPTEDGIRIRGFEFQKQDSLLKKIGKEFVATPISLLHFVSIFIHKISWTRTNCQLENLWAHFCSQNGG